MSVPSCHIPDTTSCWAAEATPRYWKASLPGNINRHLTDPAYVCKAFSSKAMRLYINGNACDGCARIPEEQR